MSYWIEIHCDANLAEDCSWMNHDGPMIGCAHVEQGRKFVLAEAKKRGWKRFGGDFYCKACAALKAQEPSHD